MLQTYYTQTEFSATYFRENVPEMYKIALTAAYYRPKHRPKWIDPPDWELTKIIMKVFRNAYLEMRDKFISEMGVFTFDESFNISADAYKNVVNKKYSDGNFESFDNYLFKSCKQAHERYLQRELRKGRKKKPLRDTYHSHIDGIDEVEAEDQIASWAKDETDEAIMRMLLESYTHEEISETLEVSTKEIQRRLAAIRAANGIA